MNREKAEKLLAALVFDDLDASSKEELTAYLQTDDELRERLTDMRMAMKVTSDALQQGPEPVLDARRMKRLAGLASRKSWSRNYTLRYMVAAAAVFAVIALPMLVTFIPSLGKAKYAPSAEVLYDQSFANDSEYRGLKPGIDLSGGGSRVTPVRKNGLYDIEFSGGTSVAQSDSDSTYWTRSDGIDVAGGTSLSYEVAAEEVGSKRPGEQSADGDKQIAQVFNFDNPYVEDIKSRGTMSGNMSGSVTNSRDRGMMGSAQPGGSYGGGIGGSGYGMGGYAGDMSAGISYQGGENPNLIAHGGNGGNGGSPNSGISVGGSLYNPQPNDGTIGSDSPWWKSQNGSQASSINDNTIALNDSSSSTRIARRESRGASIDGDSDNRTTYYYRYQNNPVLDSQSSLDREVDGIGAGIAPDLDTLGVVDNGKASDLRTDPLLVPPQQSATASTRRPIPQPTRGSTPPDVTHSAINRRISGARTSVTSTETPVPAKSAAPTQSVPGDFSGEFAVNGPEHAPQAKAQVDLVEIPQSQSQNINNFELSLREGTEASNGDFQSITRGFDLNGDRAASKAESESIAREYDNAITVDNSRAFSLSADSPITNSLFNDRNGEVEVESGAPVLSKKPTIGRLFSNRSAVPEIEEGQPVPTEEGGLVLKADKSSNDPELLAKLLERRSNEQLEKQRSLETDYRFKGALQNAQNGDVVVEGKAKYPILGDLPIDGSLFKSESTKDASAHEFAQKETGGEVLDEQIRKKMGTAKAGAVSNHMDQTDALQQYEKALGQLDKILSIDPQNQQALDQKQSLEKAALSLKQGELTEETNRKGLSLTLQANEKPIPSSDEINYPQNWKEISERRAALQEERNFELPVEDISDLPLASRFKSVPVNPWVMTERDALSTFALDVDTASYTLSRRYISSGYLPPAGAVRMEEFINYFNYQYPQQSDRTFKVHTEAAPSPFAGEGKNLTLLKIGVKARTIGRDQFKPAHLVFVIDTSASMGQPERLPLIQQALNLLLDSLTPADRITLITCSDQARLLLDAVPVSQRERIRQVINAVQPSGTTNLLAGLQLGYATARRAYSAKQVNQIVLCSDGVANVGQTEAEAVLAAVAEDRKQGITITCVGVGYGTYNDAFMESLADQGDGSYVFLDSLRQAQRVFVEQLAATLHTVAKDARIQVSFNPERVRRYRLIGYENRDIEDARFRDDTIDAGEVGSGQCSTALYELELIDSPSARQFDDFGTVFVRYRNVDTNQIEEISCDLENRIVRTRTVENSPYFYLAATAAQFAEILRQSEHVQGSNLRDVQVVADKLSSVLGLDRDVRELAELIRRSENLPRAQ